MQQTRYISQAMIRITDGEFDGVRRVIAHAIAVSATQRATGEVGEPLIVFCGYFIQERVVVAH